MVIARRGVRGVGARTSGTGLGAAELTGLEGWAVKEEGRVRASLFQNEGRENHTRIPLLILSRLMREALRSCWLSVMGPF